MAKKKTALFIGRFQPFHRGHVSVVEAALKDFDFVVVAVGSADKSRTPENPFTVGERHAMVKSALTELGYAPEKDFVVVPVVDIDDDKKWCKHVADLCPPFEAVISGNERVVDLFTKAKKKVIAPKLKYKISATDVRAAIEAGEDLAKYLHESVVSFLQKIGATRKMVDIKEELAAAEAEAKA
jgi:nicotinamide-nucleotide adenylyltransferase